MINQRQGDSKVSEANGYFPAGESLPASVPIFHKKVALVIYVQCFSLYFPVHLYYLDLLSQEEALAAQIMKDNGNSVDLTA